MKLWARRHRNLSSSRTQIACRLHAVLCDLVAGGVPDEIYAGKAASLLADIEPDSIIAAARVEFAGELLDDLRRVDRQIAESKQRLAQVIAASGTTVIGIFGVGPVVAATVVGLTGDIARFPTRDRFAAFNGTAPIEVSSGGRKGGGSRAAATAPSTTRSTWPPSPRPDGITVPAAATTTARSPKARHRKKRCDRSSDGSATRSGPPWSPTPERRRHRVDRGLGRATGGRLCRQRGRLAPRYTGSSARPLPNPNQGYDNELAPPTHTSPPNHDDHPKNCLTTKEDSFWTGGASLVSRRSCSRAGIRRLGGCMGAGWFARWFR